MTDKKKAFERRKNKRYKAANGSYAAVDPPSNEIGQITNISMGGLAFEYTDSDSFESEMEYLQEKTISLSSNGCYVSKIPFKTVSENEVATVPSFSEGSMKIKIKQIRFVGLDFNNVVDLDHYLRNNATESEE
ncbi:MAG: PilZ domain-containing protein [Desulfobacula sp.]|jgi:hypothetical protein|uniref:PilZ domain-containing protein n=1 Tax=Desulfobacula sp. TaxID=2593537 RepID=UPI001E06768A|nr:PilZ domain-containing protein [Desulfobacula sp.]MBT3486493.1 PilZ domain-containing protein [Desulfobacula sp.]MBT3806093.1 PilZ domain-containing protein [Desulfobacula sp.]MBT4023755.1 PilZ domain-containing protein [Desulfobacula sp.]MBT4197865.1 PilZ domain-containing protein [Desulfobacula sp.]